VLTIHQVQEILRISAGSKALFGDAALELGFLDMVEIGLFLATQRNERPAFSSIFYELARVDPMLLKAAIEDWEHRSS